MTPRTHLAAVVLPVLLVADSGLAAVPDQVVRLSEPVEKTSEYETFGACAARFMIRTST